MQICKKSLLDLTLSVFVMVMSAVLCDVASFIPCFFSNLQVFNCEGTVQNETGPVDMPKRFKCRGTMLRMSNLTHIKNETMLC